MAETSFDVGWPDVRLVNQLTGMSCWAAVAVPGFHAVVVTGGYGDGPLDSTFVRIDDPWDRSIRILRWTPNARQRRAGAELTRRDAQ